MIGYLNYVQNKYFNIISKVFLHTKIDYNEKLLAAFWQPK